MRTFVFCVVSLSVAAVVGTACSGSSGPAGPQGPAGEAGATGATGATGAMGATGQQGPPGTGADAGLSSGGEGGGGDATTTDSSTADAAPVVVVLSERAQIGFANAPVPLSLSGKTPAQLEQIGEGAYIVSTQAICADCHSKTPAPSDYLSGGVVIPIGPNMSVVSRNLTPDPATGLKDTVDQFIQATRNGTDTLNANTALIVHPWQYERWMGTDDLEAVYSYLRVVPAISNTYAQDVKPSAPGVTFPGFYNEGEVNRPLPPEWDFTDAAVPDPNHTLRGTAIDPLSVTPPTDPTQAALFGRGSYIVNGIVGCPLCHTHPDRDYTTANQAVDTAAFLTGGTVFAAGPFAPQVGAVRSMSANLVGATHGYFVTATFQNFLTTITEGVHADTISLEGGAPQPLAFPMPWTEFRHMAVEDLQAIYTYMNWIATHQPTTGASDVITQSAARYCTGSSGCNTAAGETCNIPTNECVGRACSLDSDCDACQTCTTNVCTAPAANSVCVLTAESL